MADTAGNLGTTMFSGHKHTNRSLPINNKICNQRWVDRCQQLHRMRLNQIKPAIGMPEFHLAQPKSRFGNISEWTA